MSLRIKTVKMIDEIQWSRFVSKTYGRPYCFQQQEGCLPRGIVTLYVENIDDMDEREKDLPDSVPVVVNGEEIGPVKFEAWLMRDLKQGFENEAMDWRIELWWHRNFYPSIDSVATDLCKRGLLEEGEYLINIDW